MSLTVVLSGATGFLGRAIAEALEARGHRVHRLVRRPSDPGEFACDLPDQLDTAAFEGADVLVHCAWDTRFQNATRAREVNVTGSRRLLDAARAAYEAGNIQDTLEELAYAQQLVREMKTAGLVDFLPDAPDGWTHAFDYRRCTSCGRPAPPASP